MVDFLSSEKSQVIRAFAAHDPDRVTYPKLCILSTCCMPNGLHFEISLKRVRFPVHQIVGHFLVSYRLEYTESFEQESAIVLASSGVSVSTGRFDLTRHLGGQCI